MKITSFDSKFSVDLNISPWGGWDDGDYVKGFEVVASYKTLNFAAEYQGQGHLSPKKHDELLEFVSRLESLFASLQGWEEFEFLLSGEPESNGELAFYKMNIRFYSLDPLGNVAFGLSCQRKHRFSNTKDFIHASSVEFQVTHDTFEKFIAYLKNQYKESRINNGNY